MDIDKMTSMASRLFFVIAVLTLGLGVFEKLANLAGYTFTRGYTPERLLEISVAFALFILVFLVRQIREDQRARHR